MEPSEPIEPNRPNRKQIYRTDRTESRYIESIPWSGFFVPACKHSFPISPPLRYYWRGVPHTKHDWIVVNVVPQIKIDTRSHAPYGSAANWHAQVAFRFCPQREAGSPNVVAELIYQCPNAVAEFPNVIEVPGLPMWWLHFPMWS